MRRLMMAAAMLAAMGGGAGAQSPADSVPFAMRTEAEARTTGALYFIIGRATPCMPADMRQGYEAAIVEGLETYRRRGSAAEWVGYARGMADGAGGATAMEINGMSPAARQATCEARANAAAMAMELMTAAMREHTRRLRGG